MRLLVMLALLFASTGVFATDSCFSRVARLLVEENTADLAGHFVASNSSVLRGIGAVTAKTGRLSQLAQGQPNEFPRLFQRLTIRSPAASTGFGSKMLDFSASSIRLGLVRVQVHIHPELDCGVLAIHVDSPFSQPTLESTGVGLDDAA
ncbi:MAG: hypothetical protein WCT47_19285 [Betaproteobacteria bacterium]|jgi:hypothetical protein